MSFCKAANLNSQRGTLIFISTSAKARRERRYVSRRKRRVKSKQPETAKNKAGVVALSLQQRRPPRESSAENKTGGYHADGEKQNAREEAARVGVPPEKQHLPTGRALGDEQINRGAWK